MIRVMTQRQLDQMLKEERESREMLAKFAFDVGYRACLVDNGGKGFITGLQQAE